MNPQVISSSVRGAVAANSKVTIGIGVLLLGFGVLGQSKSVYDWLSIVPGNIIPPLVHIQTLLTGGFVERNLVLLLCDVASVVVAGHLFEPLWGNVKYLEFVGVVNFFGCLFTAITFITLYVFTQQLHFLFRPFNGFWCVCAGYLVAFKQTNPQRKFAGVGLSVDCRFGPILLLAITAGLWFGGIFARHIPIMVAHGIWVSWTYLRFYQTRDDVQGDPGEAFAFSDLFPAPMQPAVTAVGGHLFRVAVACRVVPSKPLQYDLSQSNIVKTALPGATLSDAERRRQKAMRDLQSRLEAANADKAQAPPPAAAPIKSAEETVIQMAAPSSASPQETSESSSPTRVLSSVELTEDENK